MFLKPQTSEERAVILKFWSQHQDTLSIAGLLSRSEQYVERELHRALEVRRAVRKSLNKQKELLR